MQAAVNFAWLGWANKLGGVILYSALYLAVLSICLFYGTASHIISNHAIQASIVYPFIAPWGPALVNGLGKIIPIFKDMFKSLEDFFANLAGKIR